MNFHAATCPQCSGALQIPDDRERIDCMYCGVTIVVKEALNTAEVNVRNLLVLASKAEQGENYKEAYSLYSRVLELAPGNTEAWRGKGFSAGMQSNLISLRLDELVVCYRTSLDTCEDEKMRNVLKSEYAQQIFIVAQAIYMLSFKHVIEFISLPDARFEHADRCKEIIGICEYILDLDSSQIGAADLILEMATKCEKTSYLDEGTRNFFKNKLQRYKWAEKESGEKKAFVASSENGSLYIFLAILLLVGNYHLAKNIFGLGSGLSCLLSPILCFAEFFGAIGFVLAVLKIKTALSK